MEIRMISRQFLDITPCRHIIWKEPPSKKLIDQVRDVIGGHTFLVGQAGKSPKKPLLGEWKEWGSYVTFSAFLVPR